MTQDAGTHGTMPPAGIADGGSQGSPVAGTPTQPLVSCEEVAAHLGDPRWVVFDCRHHLKEPERGLRDYAKGHVPGARHAHVDRELSGPVGSGRMGRHPLPIPQAFLRLLGTYGVTPESQIVAYDDEGGWWASRLWWLCRHHGLDRVAVMDGGWTRWKALGLPMSAGHESPARPASLSVAAGAMPTVDVAQVEAGVGPRRLVDVRAAARFTGDLEPVDPVAGHIPGAVNVPHAELVGPDMRFLPPAAIRARYEAAGVGPEGAVVYCGSGVTATHGVLAMEVAGMPTPALYPGSWSQWCRPGAGRPIATGP